MTYLCAHSERTNVLLLKKSRQNISLKQTTLSFNSSQESYKRKLIICWNKYHFGVSIPHRRATNIKAEYYLWLQREFQFLIGELQTDKEMQKEGKSLCFNSSQESYKLGTQSRLGRTYILHFNSSQESYKQLNDTFNLLLH